MKEPKEIRAVKLAYSRRPEVKAKAKAQRETPEMKAHYAAYAKREDVKARKKAHRDKPESKVRKRKHMKEYRARFDVKAQTVANERFRLYGITPDDFAGQIEAQLGRCLICEELLGSDISVDHDHATGKFRGLLHRQCNSMLGMAKDSIPSLQNAVAYLRGQL